MYLVEGILGHFEQTQRFGHIVLLHAIGETQTRQSRGQTQNAEQIARGCEGHVLLVAGFATQLHIGAHNVVGELVGNGGILALAQINIAAHQMHVQRLDPRGRLPAVAVHVRNVLGQTQIVVPVGLVLDEPEQIETRQQSSGQLDILLHCATRIVAAEGGIGSSQDGDTRIQRGHDARLGNGNGLLLHHLVYGRTIRVSHLVELIDAADALIGQHQGAALERHFASEWILHDSCRQTHARGAAACGVLRAYGQATNVAQQLRFGHTGITHQADVDVAANLHAIWTFVHAAHEQQQQRLLHIQMAVDLGCQAGGQALIEIILGQLLQLSGRQLTILVRNVVVLVDADDALREYHIE